MATLTTLPKDVLHVLCEHLNVPDLKSLSLTTRAVAGVYQRHYSRHFAFSTSVVNLDNKIDLLYRWQAFDQLKHVHYIAIDDTAPRSNAGHGLIIDLIEDLLPYFTALKKITWHVRYMYQGMNSRGEHIDEKSEWAAQNVFSGITLPPGVEFHISCLEQTGEPWKSPVLWMLKSTPAYSNLRSLRIETFFTDHKFDHLFKSMLLNCGQLQCLNLAITPNTISAAWQSWLDDNQDDLSPLKWAPEEVARSPVLKELGFHHRYIMDSALKIWAEHADWSSLHTLTLEDGRMLEYLVGKTPRLKTLTVGAHAQIEHFLSQALNLSALTITRFRPNALAPASDDVSMEVVLAHPFARNLTSLEIRMHAPYEGENSLIPMDIRTIPSLCPNLQNLAFSLTPDEDNEDAEVEFEEWLNAAASAMKRLPHLRRFEVITPQYIKNTVVTTSTAHVLWNAIKPFGEQLSEVYITASVMHTGSLENMHSYPYNLTLVPPGFVMTFVAAVSEVDTEAAKGKYTVRCVEVLQAEAAFAREEWDNLHDSGRFFEARRTMRALEDISLYGTTGSLGSDFS